MKEGSAWPYGKRRWVPDLCPRCGRSAFVPWVPFRLEKLREPLNYYGLMTLTYGTWRKRLREYPAAPGLQCWWGICGACMIGDELMRPSTFFDTLQKYAKANDEWKGGTILIPFGRGNGD